MRGTGNPPRCLHMSLCTLPTPVSSDVFGISPAINVVLFFTETHLLLCRKSGQQVWSSRLPAPGVRPAKLEWSANGEVVAVVFDNGSMTAYDVANGRIKPKLGIESGVSSAAWSDTSTQSEEQEEDDSLLRLAAVGGTNGQLSIRVDGALVIDDLHVGSGPVQAVSVNEDLGEYAVVCDEKLSTIRIKSDNISSPSSLRSARAIAEAVRLMDSVQESIAKVSESFQDMENINNGFFRPLLNKEPDDVQLELSTLALTGFVSEFAEAWIKEQHELGFIKWYKAVSQCWNTVKNTFKHPLIPQTEHLIIIFGDISADSSELQGLLKSIYSLFRVVESRQPLFERVATFIEYVFTEEISRPISTTRLGKVDLQLVINDILHENFLGKVEPHYADDLTEYASKSRSILELKVGGIREQVRKQLTLTTAFQANGSIDQMLPMKWGYKLIIDDNKLVEINETGESKTTDIKTSGNILVSTSRNPVHLGMNVAERKVQFEGVCIDLDFEPRAITARYDNESALIACVMSEDRQHYQFVEISIQD